MNIDVRRILSETACLDVPVDTLNDHDDLYAAGLASLGTVRVMMAIEESFGIEIPGHLITHELFQSIESLAGAIGQIEQIGQIAPEEPVEPRL